MPRASLRRLHNGWITQVRVIHALMIRELTTRYGRDNIGFLWIMAEPLLFAGLVSLIWHFLYGETKHGIGVTAFIVTGYIPITLFRHGVGRSVAVFTANSSILYHRQVKILDFMVVRLMIELLGGMMAFVFIACVLMVFNEFPVPADIGLALSGWMLYAFFSFSICLIIAPLSEMSEVVEKFVPVTTYVMIPFSGLFTLVEWLTPGMREYLMWSPFVTGMEMLRKGIWGDQINAYYYPWYTITCSVVATMIGLVLCRRVRRTITVD
jgi:capsular polysaccharide transport system permease protein